MYSGLMSFDVGTQEKAWKVIDSLKIAKIMTNLGDVRTLIIHPWSTIYNKNSEEERYAAGVTPGLIRLSVGIESAQDLIADFEESLGAL